MARFGATRFSHLSLGERDLCLRLKGQRRGRRASRYAGLHDLPTRLEILLDAAEQPLLGGGLRCIDPGGHHIALDLALLGRAFSAADDGLCAQPCRFRFASFLVRMWLL